MNFTEKIAELEKILKDMDGDSLSLDTALAEYERGIALVRECRAYLAEAQQKITILSQEADTCVSVTNKKGSAGNGNSDE